MNTATTSANRYSSSEKMRCHTGLRTSFWSCACVTESTTDATADEPAQSETTKPTDTTSARPRVRMLSAVGAMIPSTTSAVNTRRAKSMMPSHRP